MTPLPANPTSWDEYEGRASPPASIRSSAVEEDPLLDADGEYEHRPLLGQARRRSSVTRRLAAMADIGGVNSFRSFARSWQRAASFAEVIPGRPSFVLAKEAEPDVDDPDDNFQYTRNQAVGVLHRPAGLLSQHLQSSPSDSPSQLPQHEADSGQEIHPSLTRDGFEDRQRKTSQDEMVSGAIPVASSSSFRSSIFAVPPHLATPDIIGSYGSHDGTMSARRYRSRSSASHERDLGIRNEDREGFGADAVNGNEHQILIKEVKQGDKVVLTVEGQSTLPQSIFNSINAIIGVGLLSLPLAFKMSGWIVGLVILTFTAIVTAHTGKLLAKCMQYDPSIITYSDLAYVAFGSRARIVVSALFTLELVAACVALVILFADSLHLLLPGYASVNLWKCICAALILVLNILPLRWLSYTSILGIFSTFSIVCVVVLDGLIKEHKPGSLWEPAQTHLLPSNWLSIPLAYGLMASPWGAHSVFPSIYRDMRHPHKWRQGVNVTFSFSYIVDTCLAVIGLLMFGDGITEAITSNILETPGYPELLKILMCILITIIPLTKIPLNARPLITTADVVCGVHRDYSSYAPSSAPQASVFTSLVRSLVRGSVVLVLLGISILFPAFDSVCAFLGAALCSLVSIILPICFYLKLYRRDICKRERVISWILLVVFSILGLLGTVWTFLPKHLVGA